MSKFKIGPYQEAWLRSLESGEHKQCRGNLTVKKDGKFYHCCLGVACEMFIVNGVHVECVGYPGSFSSSVKLYEYDGDDVDLPDNLCNELGLHDTYGCFELNQYDEKTIKQILRDSNKNTSLIDMNDTGMRFKTIAKFIRKWPEVVFKESK